MKINCYLETGKIDHGVICALQEIVKNLIQKYPEIEFNSIDSAAKRAEANYLSAAAKYGAYYLIIENPKTQKYILVSYGDKMLDLTRAEWDLENCVEIFSSIGNHQDDVEYKKQTIVKHTPISYVCGSYQNEKMLNEMYSERMQSGEERAYPDKLSFRGQLYLFRRHLYYDKRFNITGELLELDKNGETAVIESSRLPEAKYLRELDSRAINLSLNGTGEICFRDMEILGLGSALLRLKLVTEFHNKLIPDYHYIAVDFDDIEQGATGYELYCDRVAQRILEKFNEVKEDKDFIDFISKNGRKWYEENGTVERNGKIAADLIDLRKIIE